MQIIEVVYIEIIGELYKIHSFGVTYEIPKGM